MRRIISRRAIVVAALLAAATASIAQPKPIKIGLVLPYRGVWAQLSEPMERGFQLAIDEYGPALGRPIEIIRADDELTPSVAVQRFNKLVSSDQVDLIAGVIGSNVAIALSELADRAKKPIVFSGSFADEVTGKYCSPYVARTSFSANGFQFNAGKYWASKGIKTAFILGPDYAAGHAWLGAFRRGFQAAGGKVVQEAWTPFQKTKDWGPALTQASTSGAQMIYSIYAGNEAAQVVKQHAEFGLREKLPLIGDQWVYDEGLWPALGDLVYGAKFIASYFPELENSENKKFVAAYQKKYGKVPEINAALGYDNGKAIMLALGKTAGVMPADGAQFISNLRSLDFDSPRGKIRFNKHNSAQLEKVYVLELVKQSNGQPRRKLLDTFAGEADLPQCEKSF
ncbi:ABC transporter substrate-binding protein [Variovorax sp. Root411]|uniref:ABC transporter substrate-binding protein n=1 Tax=Variovorax sp. Root411 TaxID=1736530 RepID=UPI0006F4AC32|nr:ABC transporter substrate-binding protein [Variovorax sp. Root411]KQW61776.1 ABC transporter [Variovorax sp. Root411]